MGMNPGSCRTPGAGGLQGAGGVGKRRLPGERVRGMLPPDRRKDMAFETLQTELRDRILTITLHRPERLNAFTPRMLEECLRVLDDADADDEGRVVVFP